MEELQWYAIRVTYSREMIVQRQLTQAGIESYIPMLYAERTAGNTRQRVLVPAIHNLIFIRITPAEIRDLKATTALPIRYIMDRETRTPVIIPDREMENFRAVMQTGDDNVEVVATPLPQLQTGMRVRVTEGVFKGVEGIYLRYKGQSKVAVAISEIATALTAFVPVRFIETIE